MSFEGTEMKRPSLKKKFTVEFNDDIDKKLTDLAQKKASTKSMSSAGRSRSTTTQTQKRALERSRSCRSPKTAERLKTSYCPDARYAETTLPNPAGT